MATFSLKVKRQVLESYLMNTDIRDNSCKWRGECKEKKMTSNTRSFKALMKKERDKSECGRRLIKQRRNDAP